jgi:hypothetical protein
MSVAGPTRGEILAQQRLAANRELAQAVVELLDKMRLEKTRGRGARYSDRTLCAAILAVAHLAEEEFGVRPTTPWDPGGRCRTVPGEGRTGDR